MNVYYEAYGCSQNIAETGMLARGFGSIVESPEEADIIVIGTCIVIAHTEHRMIRRINELKEYGKKVVVYGCLPSALPERVPDGVLTVKTWELERAHDIVGASPMNQVHTMDAVATIPISNGCMGSCAYCITRLARGRVHSRSPEWVVKQVKNALSMGCREIRLSAQDTATYGRDLGTTLPELLERILEIDGEFRIRVGMMEPRETLKILDELLEVYREPRVYKFLHLPVQSGDDGILSRMNRGYTVEDFIRIVDAFRKQLGDFLLSTDIIVGFPGESEESINNTARLLMEIKPEILNITRFSPRPKTPAYRWKRPSTNDVKRWSAYLTNLYHGYIEKINERFVGTNVRVLVAQHGKRGRFTARTDQYRPVIIEQAPVGKFVNVRITSATPSYLVGELRE